MSDLLTKDQVTRVSRALRAAWYRLPDCPGELYVSEANALAKAALEALEPDPAALGEAAQVPNNFPAGKLSPPSISNDDLRQAGAEQSRSNTGEEQ